MDGLPWDPNSERNWMDCGRSRFRLFCDLHRKTQKLTTLEFAGEIFLRQYLFKTHSTKNFEFSSSIRGARSLLEANGIGKNSIGRHWLLQRLPGLIGLGQVRNIPFFSRRIFLQRKNSRLIY